MSCFDCTRHDLTETTRAMAKRGSEDLKKLSELQAALVRPCVPTYDKVTKSNHCATWGLAASKDGTSEDFA